MTALLPYRLSICGLEEFRAYEQERISHVISILDPGFPEPAGLARLPRHVLIRLHFDDVVDPAPAGSLPPSHEDVANLLVAGERIRADKPSHLLVHCHAGISRSTATAALIMAYANPGHEEAAFEALKVIRPRCWPNSRMIRLGDEIMGRRGALVAALERFQGWITRTHPEVARLVALHGRAHEIPEAALKRLQSGIDR